VFFSFNQSMSKFVEHSFIWRFIVRLGVWTPETYMLCVAVMPTQSFRTHCICVVSSVPLPSGNQHNVHVSSTMRSNPCLMSPPAIQGGAQHLRFVVGERCFCWQLATGHCPLLELLRPHFYLVQVQSYNYFRFRGRHNVFHIDFDDISRRSTFHCDGDPWKHGSNIWNHISTCYRSKVITTSGFSAAILYFT